MCAPAWLDAIHPHNLSFSHSHSQAIFVPLSLTFSHALTRFSYKAARVGQLPNVPAVRDGCSIGMCVCVCVCVCVCLSV
jgi:hypothetical protein